MTRKRDVFTTGQAAALARVAPRTISKWFDSGRLKGYRLAGSKDRRIPRQALIDFFLANGMPQAQELIAEDRVTILTVGLEPRLKDALTSPNSDRIAFVHTDDPFQAGLSIGKLAYPPRLVVMDSDIGFDYAGLCIRYIRGQEALAKSTIVVITGVNGVEKFDGADLTFKRPFDVGALSSQLSLYTGENAAA